LAAVLGAPRPWARSIEMEIAAVIMVSTVLLWFVEETADEHI
jgi:hypothetical protein